MEYKASDLKTFLNYWRKSIEKLPNIRYLGHPDLRKKSEKVKEFDRVTKGQITKIKNTFKKFREATRLGRGIAAPQLGIMKRIIVIFWDGKYKALVNPEIVDRSKELTIAEELCISMGNLSAMVVRPKYVTVKYKDETGKINILNGNIEISRLLQHEIDHLDGILCTDKAIKNGLRFVYSLRQFKGITDFKTNEKCPCASGKTFAKCCGK